MSKITPSISPRLKPMVMLLALGFAVNTQAQTEAAAKNQLEQVQITAKRGNETNTTVNAKRIEVEQANSLQDLFKQTPEVSLGGGGLPIAQKIYVHGIAERMLTITIDGASQPESAYHHAGQVMIEPELIKRVEIEAGTGAATAGPGALAGAVRFTTKNASDLLSNGERFGALLKGGYQTVNKGSKFSGTVYGRLTDDLDLIFSQTVLKSSDYKDGHGNTVANTAIDTSSSFLKLNGKIDGGHRFQLSYDKNEDEGLRNQRTNMLVTAINPAQQQRMSRQSTTANYDYAPGNPLLSLHATVYNNENIIQLQKGSSDEERLGTKTQGFNLSNVSRLGDHKLSYGFDYKKDTGLSRVAGVSLNDEKAKVSGVYLQDDMVLGAQWMLGLGARYDKYSYTDMKRQKFDSSGVSPSVNLEFIPSDGLTLRLSHARALRGVGIVEPFLKQYQDNDVSINPEKAQNTEFGVQWKSAGWQINGSIFEQKIANYIGYDDYRDNMGNVKVRGYNASIGLQEQQWSGSLGVSHSKPELNGSPLSSGDAFLLGNASSRTWVAQLDYALPNPALKFGWTGRFVEKLSFVPEGSATKPGYGVHDLYAHWLPTGKDDFTVTFSVKNVLNKFYYDQSSFGYHPRWSAVAALPEIGRDLRISLAWKI
ncbi:TonB-dependent receptor domain-containing protein [Undibacterium sp. Di27W]|uniref:TonB-dependent receptor domain-containing protein n=1 Tax=Undibacterium sp. Di27W TaxID=3413036 RepID=UPI003BF077A9